MKNFIIRFGVGGAIVSIALGLLNWFFIAQPYGKESSQLIGYLSIIISLFCIPLGIKYYRDKLNSGELTFREGFKIGLGITTITSIIMFFYGILFFVIEGDHFKEWQESGLTPSELEQLKIQISNTPDFIMTPWFQGFILFLTIFIIGMIMNLFSSIILKKVQHLQK